MNWFYCRWNNRNNKTVSLFVYLCTILDHFTDSCAWYLSVRRFILSNSFHYLKVVHNFGNIVQIACLFYALPLKKYRHKILNLKFLQNAIPMITVGIETKEKEYGFTLYTLILRKLRRFKTIKIITVEEQFLFRFDQSTTFIHKNFIRYKLHGITSFIRTKF